MIGEQDPVRGGTVTPDDAVRQAGSQALHPVYLVVGEERVLSDRVVAALRKACLQGGLADFNEDVLAVPEAGIERVMNAVRTAPMMARKRFVLVKGVEHWDSAAGEKGKASSQAGHEALDQLATYAASPIDSTCLVLVASKIDGRRKLAALARTKGFLVACEPVARAALPRFIEKEARDRGHEIPQDVADLLAEIAGPELGGVLDALERLSLFVGPKAPITEADVAACVTRIRPSSVWELVGAVGKKDAATALRVFADVYDPQDRGLPLVGLLAWSTRQLLRFSAALRGGASAEAAAKAAGAPPFRARELAAQVKKIPERELERWLATLAETDLALKGSRRPPRAILESAILTMTRSAPR